MHLPSRATVTLLIATVACGPSTRAPGSPAPSEPAITPAALRTRLSIYADDSMQGRKAGTPGNVKATDYLAAQARLIGLVPAGDNGTYFQTIPLQERTLVSAASVQAGGQSWVPGRDFIARDQGVKARPIDGLAVVDGGPVGDPTHHSAPPSSAYAGKMVVIRPVKDDGSPVGMVPRALVTQQFAAAAAIAVASLDVIGETDRQALMTGGAQLAKTDDPEQPAFLYVTSSMAEALLRAGTVRGTIAFMDVPAPSPARNVVAILPGSDPALKGQYIAIGAHNDHVGMQASSEDHDSLRAWNSVMRRRGAEKSPGVPTAAETDTINRLVDSLRKLRPRRADSVFNGADDDGSGSVSVLEIAQALARSPERPRRSILFVWHTAEELGLLGSDWFTRHPTVPRDSIVAQLNIDMIGRGRASDLPHGGPAYVQLIGSRRLSTELGDLVERVNTDGKHGLAFDYTWDANGHPENSYCRSDHYMYARFGIPITFFTTGGHRDYHMLTDEVQYIDFEKMARVGGLVEDVALRLANLDHRLVVDHPKPDPDAPCRQ